MTPTRHQIIGWTLALALVALFAAANLLNIQSLWGFNFFTFLPPIWIYPGLLAIALSLLPPATKTITHLGDSLGKLIAQNDKNRVVITIVAVVGCGALFWFLSARLPLLGDGSLRAREIFDGRFWQPTEAGDFFIHALLFKLVIKPLGLEVTQTFRYISILSGIGCLIGAYRLFAHLASARAVFWTIVAFSSGCIVLFFGYVESYSILASLLPWVIRAGLKAADRTGSVATFTCWVVIAGIVHSLAFIIFGASLIGVLCSRSTSCRSWIKSHRLLIAVGVLSVIPLVVAGKALDLPVISQFISPLSSTPAEPTALFSLRWLLNIVNWILLSGLAIPALLTALAGRRSSPDDSNASFFVWTVIVPAFLFVLLFAPKLGGPIDWDLFSIPLAAILLSLIVLIDQRVTTSIPRWLFPVVTVAVVNLAGFVAVNASTTISAERFSRIIPLTGSPNPWIHWSSLVVHAEHQPELYNRRNEFLLNSWQAPPNNRRDSVTTLTKLMHEAVVAGDTLSARTIVGILNTIEGLPPEVLSSESEVFARFGTRDEQLEYADMLAAQFPNSPVALGTAGIIYLGLGINEKCGEVLSRSYALDSSNALTALNYGVFLANHQDPAAALPVLRQAYTLNQTSFVAAYYLAHAYLALGDIDNAKAALLRAEANALRPEEQTRIKQLKMQFR